MTPYAVAIAALAFNLTLGSASLQAAPATSEELERSTPNRSTSGQTPATGLDQPATTGVQQSKTIELLLQMQDQPNAVRDAGGTTSKGEPTRRPATTTLPRAADVPAPAASNPLLELKASLLGSGSGTGSALTDRGGDEERVHDRVPSSSSLAPSWSGARTGNSESRSSLLSHPAVRFIRENRGLTIAVSLGVLAAVWLAANYRGRAHRR